LPKVKIVKVQPALNLPANLECALPVVEPLLADIHRHHLPVRKALCEIEGKRSVPAPRIESAGESRMSK
jgi:hypothetical protein